MRTARLCAAAALMLALSGCASTTPRQMLVGVWVGTVSASTGAKPTRGHVTVEFRGDGTLRGTERIEGVGAPLTFSGTWTLEGDGTTVEIKRDDSGVGAQATLRNDRLITGRAPDSTVYVKRQWWRLW